MSISVTKMLCSLFIVLSYFTCFVIADCLFTSSVTVYIFNGIPDSTIDVHVKSGDDDLGHHNITLNLWYDFHFCEIFFGNTLFTGDFADNSRSAHFHVYDEDVSKNVDGSSADSINVYWLLKQDGYYLSKEFKPYDDPSWVYRGSWE
ncbi:S-protein homolog 2-like [Helianthus annuus]|uniref:S-protein homolog 2-like n=1 Tax=Helianthus annuus TaxID=4232 RepID=UPI000B9062E9|nr:S-protein homolog 2-like [Helianthus annuus]